MAEGKVADERNTAGVWPESGVSVCGRNFRENTDTDFGAGLLRRKVRAKEGSV
jgi:hypothetical protein